MGPGIPAGFSNIVHICLGSGEDRNGPFLRQFSGQCKEVFRAPRHPYTIGLLESVPRPDEELGRKLVPIPGSPPDLLDLQPTCAFLARCSYRIDRCCQEPWPELQPVDGDVAHQVGCHVATSGAARRTARRAVSLMGSPAG